MIRRTSALPLALAAAAALAGCSQVAAIAPVGGGHLSEVRYAAIDVLTSAHIEILTAPVCTQSADETVSCDGAAADGRAIHVSGTAPAQDVVTVTVGADTVYDGSVQAVLEKAMQG